MADPKEEARKKAEEVIQSVCKQIFKEDAHYRTNPEWVKAIAEALQAKADEIGWLRKANSAANILIGEGADEAQEIVHGLEARLATATARIAKLEEALKEIDLQSPSDEPGVMNPAYSGWRAGLIARTALSNDPPKPEAGNG